MKGGWSSSKEDKECMEEKKIKPVVKKKEGKKPLKIVGISLLSAVTLFGAFLGGYAIGQNTTSEKQDVGNLSIDAVSGIKVKCLRTIDNPDGTFSKEISYVLEPEGVKADEFDTLISWNQGDNKDYDWEYDSNKSIEEYISYTLNTEAKTILFTCKKAFGRQIDFYLILKNDPSIKATVVLNYERKVLTKAKSSLSLDKFTDKKPIQVNLVNTVYSTGTKGRKADNVKLQVEYDATSVTFRSLFGECNNPSTYSSGIYQYLGVKYSGTENFVNAMLPKVDEYIRSTITFEGNTSFTRAELSKYTSFEYVMYRTFRDEYGTDSHITNDFIKNYKQAVKKGSGYRVKVFVNDEVILNQLIDLDMNVNLVTSVRFEQSYIDF
mgnify:CR=1 FL=1